MPQFTVSVCFCAPGKNWHQDTSRDVTATITAGNGVQAVIAVLENLQFDDRAELVHFIHVGGQ
ncbi:hypothetical protein IVB41_12165 [Bradyrhizobium sp. 44]|uniref:hypothetical protein n=1 Tax=Bradyrhizobium sp. 44 TaxID=2782675 RepID=UPI001FF97449|nr:hypothetical protein [Bradyrhizobium sp. 44]MCK1284673.1 hypothetical protein [Bradyrhizobium sp. 44]